MIVDEGVIVEIVRPGTGDPVPAGEVGEVVVTTFNRDYPMIRFATGDLSAVLPGAKPVRAHQHAHQGLARPRRPDDQGQGHVRASRAGGGGGQAPSGPGPRSAWWSAAQGEQDVMTLRAEAADVDAGLADQARRDPAGGHQAQGRGRDGRPGLAPQRRQGDRRRAHLRVAPSRQRESSAGRIGVVLGVGAREEVGDGSDGGGVLEQGRVALAAHGDGRRRGWRVRISAKVVSLSRSELSPRMASSGTCERALNCGQSSGVGPSIMEIALASSGS